MSEKFIVGYDGSDSAKRAVQFAVARATAQGGTVLIAHILEWSPFSFLTPTELEERHKRRQEELARAEAAITDPILAELAGSEIEISAVVKYGHIADTLSRISETEEATQIVIGRNGHSAAGSRLFGSVAGSLAQSSPVPCTIVP